MLTHQDILDQIRPRFEAKWQAETIWDANVRISDVIIGGVELSRKGNIVLIVNVEFKLTNKVTGEDYSGFWTHHGMTIVYNPRLDKIVNIKE